MDTQSVKVTVSDIDLYPVKNKQKGEMKFINLFSHSRNLSGYL